MEQHLRPYDWPPKNSGIRSGPCNLDVAASKAVLGPSPKVNNDREHSNSSLHASAEALLLLNNARIDFAPASSAEPEKENKRTFEIPITAPIPLSYSVRGVEALRSILSVGEDLDEMGEPTNFEGVQQSDWQPGRPTFHPGENFLTEEQEDGSTNQATVAIRPITPSTLMALTEPCLMAWCLDTGADSKQIAPTNTTNLGPEYNPAFFAEGHIDNSYILETTTCNLWGY